ncbi:NAD(P)/FAD-dependent oxidoreductase [Taibaiella soli]|uniref:NAD(P)/FAD-dependent oxidoreductase n=2 Tax=Taibaiella soli TaxID=1649169 RepID=A0A2W2AB73_9BACT|nr:NAD(P)/FAD-dependent oxidoreductase [Taibaiella soli]
MHLAEIKPDYDVVVIGAGMGGLTAAALLSKAGYSVCVLEKEPHAGGYLAGFRRKDFRFDTAIHWLNQCAPGGMASRVFDFLGNDYPRAIPQKRIRRYKGESYDYLLTNEPDKLKVQWQQEFPEDKEGIEHFFAAAKKIGHAFANFSHVFRSEETMSATERLSNKWNLLRFAMAFIPWLRYTGEKGMKKGLARFFTSEKLKKVFAADTEMLSCLVPIGWAYYGDFQSPPYGGGQVLPEWLVHLIRYYNNDLHFRCSVQQILLNGNICNGVIAEQRGKRYEIRSRYVIAACDVETLYEKMLPCNTVKPAFLKKLQEAELYSSSVTVSIALDCSPAELGFNEELIHLAAKGKSIDDCNCGDPEKAEISILAPSFRDPSLAPEGKGTLTLFMPAYFHSHADWQTEKDEAGNYIRGEAYKTLKNKIADVLIRRVEEQVVPGLRSHILFCDVATPVTHLRYTGNKNGTMMGAKPGRKNMQSKVAHYQTPVQNLLLGGHWAELGGGVPIAVKAGANAALLILRKEKPDAFRLLAGYMDGKKQINELKNHAAFLPYNNSWKQIPTPAQRLAAKMKNDTIQ